MNKLEKDIQLTESFLNIDSNLDMILKIEGRLPDRSIVILKTYIISTEQFRNNRFFSKRIRWIASRFHYFNPHFFEVNPHIMNLQSKKNDKEIKKIEITTCKRMITKISNAIKRYEDFENKKLFPNLESDDYLTLKNKLEKYQNRLKIASNEN